MYMYICICIYTHTYIYTHKGIHTYTQRHTYIHLSGCGIRQSFGCATSTRIQNIVHTQTYMHAYMHTYMHTYLHTYTSVDVESDKVLDALQALAHIVAETARLALPEEVCMCVYMCMHACMYVYKDTCTRSC